MRVKPQAHPQRQTNDNCPYVIAPPIATLFAYVVLAECPSFPRRREPRIPAPCPLPVIPAKAGIQARVRVPLRNLVSLPLPPNAKPTTTAHYAIAPPIAIVRIVRTYVVPSPSEGCPSLRPCGVMRMAGILAASLPLAPPASSFQPAQGSERFPGEAWRRGPVYARTSRSSTCPVPQRRHPRRCGLSAVERTEFRQVSQQAEDGHRPDAGHAAQQLFPLPPHRTSRKRCVSSLSTSRSSSRAAPSFPLDMGVEPAHPVPLDLPAASDQGFSSSDQG